MRIKIGFEWQQIKFEGYIEITDSAVYMMDSNNAYIYRKTFLRDYWQTFDSVSDARKSV